MVRQNIITPQYSAFSKQSMLSSDQYPSLAISTAASQSAPADAVHAQVNTATVSQSQLLGTPTHASAAAGLHWASHSAASSNMAMSGAMTCRRTWGTCAQARHLRAHPSLTPQLPSERAPSQPHNLAFREALHPLCYRLQNTTLPP